MLGREPVLSKQREPLVDSTGRRSYVTSAGAGPSIGKHILMSYLPPENANVGEELLVEYLGEQYPVMVATNDSTPVFDPASPSERASAAITSRCCRSSKCGSTASNFARSDSTTSASTATTTFWPTTQQMTRLFIGAP